MSFTPFVKAPSWPFIDRRLLIMKIAFFLTFLFVLQATAEGIAQKITLHAKNTNLRHVMKDIQRQQGYSFLFRGDHIADTRINVQIEKVDFADAMRKILEGHHLEWSLEDDIITIRPATVRPKKQRTLAVEKSQQRIISGLVVDKDGNPLEGVTVRLKNKDLETTTSLQGTYEIQVPSEATVLVFSMIGYGPEEVAIANKSVINITLQPAINNFEEVVVVGYGTVRKSDLTGAVAQVKTAQLEAVPVYNIEQAMKAGATGVRVVQNSGAPGARMEVRIRGANSMIGDNQPLYVVDGFPITGDISYLNPSDIESMDILKDASATAIYGARGANGVVIITSKKGKSGQPTRIDVQSQFGIQEDIKRMEVLDAREYAIIANEWLKNANQDPIFNLDEIQGPGTDWQREILRKAPMHNHTITISGSSEKTRYSLSGNYYDQDGIIINTGAKRGSVRMNMDHRLFDWLSMDFNVNLSRRERFQVPVDNGNAGNSMYSGAISAPPTLSITDENGLYTQIRQIYSFAEVSNPMVFSEPYKNRNLTNVVVGNTSFTVNLAEGLTFKTLLGLETHHGASELFVPLIYPNDRGAASQGTSYRTSFLNENILNYTKSFGTQQRLDLTGGFTFQNDLNRFSNIGVSGFSNNNTANFNLGVAETINPPSSGISRWAMSSWLARANYSLAEKYLFTASIRADGSSRFGENNKWAAFPSGAVAWRASNEPFLQDIEAINDLKVRASIGMTGNTALSPYQSLDRISPVRSIYGNSTEIIGYVPTGIANPALRWETTTQADVGVDVTLWNNRVTVTADYFNKRTTDLLASVPLPPSIGFGTMLQNIGEIRNQGFEFDVSSNILTKEFKWNAAVRLSTNRSKIISLAGGNDIFSSSLDLFRSSMNIAREGYPFGMFFGLVEDGLDDQGRIKYVDQNQDGEINALDRIIIGNPYPDFIYGINSDFSYKGFELNLFIEGVSGNDIFWATAGNNLNSFQRGSNQFRDLIGNYWTAENPNPNAKYPRVSSTSPLDVSDRFIEDGSYIRLKSVRLAYNIPIDKLTNSKIKRAQIYISGVNLFTITNYPGIDPDVNTTGSDSQGVGDRLRMGIDQTAYPTAKMYLAGINFSF